ncbi:hypothetical protein HDU98_011771, partial [Podochytrium sp. JEL0797]
MSKRDLDDEPLGMEGGENKTPRKSLRSQEIATSPVTATSAPLVEPTHSAFTGTPLPAPMSVTLSEYEDMIANRFAAMVAPKRASSGEMIRGYVLRADVEKLVRQLRKDGGLESEQEQVRTCEYERKASTREFINLLLQKDPENHPWFTIPGCKAVYYTWPLADDFLAEHSCAYKLARVDCHTYISQQNKMPFSQLSSRMEYLPSGVEVEEQEEDIEVDDG